VRKRPRRRSLDRLAVPDGVKVGARGPREGAGVGLVKRGEDEWKPVPGERGLELARRGSVFSVEVAEGLALGLVRGSDAKTCSASVEIEDLEVGDLSATCTCPAAEQWPSEWCEHAVALLFVVASAASGDPSIAEWFLGAEDPADEPAQALAITVECADAEEVSALQDRLRSIDEPEAAEKPVTYRFAASVLAPPDEVAALFDEVEITEA